MARTCLFCGGSPLTAEHVFPLWLHEVMGTSGHVKISMGSRVLRTGPRLDVKLRRVCRTCNNRWMSALEGDFQGLMAGAIHGRPTRLDAAAQRTVALWAAKTWILLELALAHDRGGAGYRSDATNHWLYAHREPPPYLQVWAGGLEPQSDTIAWAAMQPVGDPLIGVVGAFTVGLVFFQLYSPASETGIIRADEWLRLGIGPGLRQGLVPLWPVEEPVAALPPRLLFNLEELDRSWVSGKRITPPVV
jgi:hypothetical protein